MLLQAEATAGPLGLTVPEAIASTGLGAATAALLVWGSMKCAETCGASCDTESKETDPLLQKSGDDEECES